MLNAYIKRFNDVLATIHNPQENRVMMAAISGVRPKTPFWDKLQKEEFKSLQEFYRHANKIMHLKTAIEAVQAEKSTLSEKNNDHNKKRKNRDHLSSLDKTTKKAKAPDLRVLRSPPSKYMNYTALVALWEDVFFAVEQSRVFKAPDPLWGDRSKGN